MTEENRPYWELRGPYQQNEAVYWDEEGQHHFPTQPGYVTPTPEQEEQVRAGHRVYADERPATEAAVEKASELGVNLGDVEGTGVGNRVLVEDVERAAMEKEASEDQGGSEQ